MATAAIDNVNENSISSEVSTTSTSAVTGDSSFVSALIQVLAELMDTNANTEDVLSGQLEQEGGLAVDLSNAMEDATSSLEDQGVFGNQDLSNQIAAMTEVATGYETQLSTVMQTTASNIQPQIEFVLKGMSNNMLKLFSQMANVNPARS